MGERTRLSKPRRIRDPKAIRACRKPFCEFCGVSGGVYQVHHIKHRASGGHDLPFNLINLCVGCHSAVHNGMIPRWRLVRIVAQREQLDCEILRDTLARGLETYEANEG